MQYKIQNYILFTGCSKGLGQVWAFLYLNTDTPQMLRLMALGFTTLHKF